MVYVLKLKSWARNTTEIAKHEDEILIRKEEIEVHEDKKAKGK